jgi:hypothetical protein
MEEMNPRMGIRLGHPTEVAWHFLDGMLFQLGQNAEPLVGHRGSGRGVIRTIAAARTGLSINGVVCQIGPQCVFERRQEGRACWLGQARHGP